VHFSGAASGLTELAGLHLLLPVNQWELWVLLTQGHWFSWYLRVKVAGSVVAGSMEL
jgi:hypothetical protein